MRCIRVFATILLFSGHVLAQPDIQFKDNFQQEITPNPTQNMHALTQNKLMPKSVPLLRVELSDHAKNILAERLKTTSSTTNKPHLTKNISKLPPQIQLGMNHVPVLDQGQHGSCAMFANTAVVDALLKRGDYISQLCLLQLGKHLEHFGYNASGWNGSIGPIILQQIQAFGMISKTTQTEVGCGGLTNYPAHDKMPETDMPLSEYHELSEPLAEGQFAWSPLLDFYKVLLDKTEAEYTLYEVKNALSHHDRLTMGVLLFGPQYGVSGATAQHHAPNDTWVLPDMRDMIFSWNKIGGHAMIITGYDDDAVALDPDGYEHRGLLTLRNSWGEHIGDHGDFYMSYDYFQTLAIEVQRIRSLNALMT
ncbi:MAG: C1 family peptidase [Legionellaceae bacterium]|nr:C1 family peptidase [Legionellaceae bacterium]